VLYVPPVGLYITSLFDKFPFNLFFWHEIIGVVDSFIHGGNEITFRIWPGPNPNANGASIFFGLTEGDKCCTVTAPASLVHSQLASRT
jgi:hypothetical protein